METETLKPEVQVDLAGIMLALADYQIQRDVKASRQMVLTQEHMDALNDLLDLSFTNRAPLMEIGFMEPMQKIVKRMLNSSMESIHAHNEDAANMLGAVTAVQDKIGEAVSDYERRRKDQR